MDSQNWSQRLRYTLLFLGLLAFAYCTNKQNNPLHNPFGSATDGLDESLEKIRAKNDADLKRLEALPKPDPLHNPFGSATDGLEESLQKIRAKSEEDVKRLEAKRKPDPLHNPFGSP